MDKKILPLEMIEQQYREDLNNIKEIQAFDALLSKSLLTQYSVDIPLQESFLLSSKSKSDLEDINYLKYSFEDQNDSSKALLSKQKKMFRQQYSNLIDLKDSLQNSTAIKIPADKTIDSLTQKRFFLIETKDHKKIIKYLSKSFLSQFSYFYSISHHKSIKKLTFNPVQENFVNNLLKQPHIIHELEQQHFLVKLFQESINLKNFLGNTKIICSNYKNTFYQASQKTQKILKPMCRYGITLKQYYNKKTENIIELIQQLSSNLDLINQRQQQILQNLSKAINSQTISTQKYFIFKCILHDNQNFLSLLKMPIRTFKCQNKQKFFDLLFSLCIYPHIGLQRFQKIINFISHVSIQWHYFGQSPINLLLRISLSHNASKLITCAEHVINLMFINPCSHYYPIFHMTILQILNNMLIPTTFQVQNLQNLRKLHENFQMLVILHKHNITCQFINFFNLDIDILLKLCKYNPSLKLHQQSFFLLTSTFQSQNYFGCCKILSLLLQHPYYYYQLSQYLFKQSNTLFITFFKKRLLDNNYEHKQIINKIIAIYLNITSDKDYNPVDQNNINNIINSRTVSLMIKWIEQQFQSQNYYLQKNAIKEMKRVSDGIQNESPKKRERKVPVIITFSLFCLYLFLERATINQKIYLISNSSLLQWFFISKKKFLSSRHGEQQMKKIILLKNISLFQQQKKQNKIYLSLEYLSKSSELAAAFLQYLQLQKLKNIDKQIILKQLCKIDSRLFQNLYNLLRSSVSTDDSTIYWKFHDLFLCS